MCLCERANTLNGIAIYMPCMVINFGTQANIVYLKQLFCLRKLLREKHFHFKPTAAPKLSSFVCLFVFSTFVLLMLHSAVMDFLAWPPHQWGYTCVALASRSSAENEKRKRMSFRLFYRLFSRFCFVLLCFDFCSSSLSMHFHYYYYYYSLESQVQALHNKI